MAVYTPEYVPDCRDAIEQNIRCSFYYILYFVIEQRVKMVHRLDGEMTMLFIYSSLTSRQ